MARGKGQAYDKSLTRYSGDLIQEAREMLLQGVFPIEVVRTLLKKAKAANMGFGREKITEFVGTAHQQLTEDPDIETNREDNLAMSINRWEFVLNETLKDKKYSLVMQAMKQLDRLRGVANVGQAMHIKVNAPRAIPVNPEPSSPAAIEQHSLKDVEKKLKSLGIMDAESRLIEDEVPEISSEDAKRLVRESNEKVKRTESKSDDHNAEF